MYGGRIIGVESSAMNLVLSHLLSYLISLAAGLRGQAISERRRRKLEEALEKEARQLFAINSLKSLREQLGLVGAQAARLMNEMKAGAVERPLFELTADEVFQDQLATWLVMWDLEQAAAAKQELVKQMRAALEQGAAGPEQIEWFEKHYFDLVDNLMFENAKLARWRHHLGIVTLKEQHDEIIKRMKQLAGEFSAEQRRQGLDFYRELALKTCDIIDLAGLPEDDRHIAVKNFILRQLYIPLRVRVERGVAAEEAGEEGLEGLEERREVMRRRDAGWLSGAEGAEGVQEKDKERKAVGELLESSRKLVVLGDPGSGKTTLTRWLATACLLRLKKDKELAEFPDVATLPGEDWVPVIVRCRELDVETISGPFEDILRQTIRMNEVPSELIEPLRAVFRELLAEGRAVLLVDGLDEITDPLVRCRFCRKLEQIATIFDRAPMLVTSRIVGYREMRFRMGHGFEHTTVTDLSKEDKDRFAKRWCAVTEPEERQRRSADELIKNIHSSDRIERLTGNPMLLTTLALVKRKVGKLPSRRVDLYREAVQVLLNWRSEIDEPIEWREAVPQLEYVAYAMCDAGVQQLRRDEIIKLLEDVREKYPNIRPVRRRTPEEFVGVLERRTSILVEAGHTYVNGEEVPVYEFRHLTFQEYLAALALVEGRFAGHEKGSSLAERVGRIAGKTTTTSEFGKAEAVVTENWREALRLCIAACNDDEVDDALEAILTPMPEEDAQEMVRPRAIMAGLCLADEPNVTEQVAEKILRAFANCVKGGDGTGMVVTALDAAAMELGRSEWVSDLQGALVEEFIGRFQEDDVSPGGLCGMVGAAMAPASEGERAESIKELVCGVALSDEAKAIESALTIMELAYEGKAVLVPNMVDSLLSVLHGVPPVIVSSLWALFWLCGGHYPEPRGVWKPEAKDVDILLPVLPNVRAGSWEFKMCVGILGRSEDRRCIEPVKNRLEEADQSTRKYAVQALARLKRLSVKQVKLLSGRPRNRPRWSLEFVDPAEPITEEQVAKCAEALKISEAEVRRRYEELAEDFKLKLEWKEKA
jgi:energy-coupling factor transporter ATP-binding protein EcfA2